ncbi:MAG: glutamine synthetase family protein, partial [Candidatus Marinimicrobia bacterium]|nr:glutamine synthetase family protein [Candidatus Neomarinimicrobiota bacterium]
MNSKELPRIKEQLKEAYTTKLFFTDLNGRLKNLAVNPDDIEAILEKGVGIDGSSIAGIATVDNSDRILKPVLESFRLVDFGDRKIGFFVGQIFNQDGSRCEVDPRYPLEKAVEKAASDHQIKFVMGPEHEFFLLNGDEFDSNIHTDKLDYFGSSPTDVGDVVRQEIVNVLENCGVKYEKTHHEVTESQHEINLEPGDPLTIADRTILFEFVTKEVAAQFDLHATFMAKPFTGCNRNAFHIHISFTDMNGQNLCYDENAENNLSASLMNFIGGITKHAREASIVMASTFNSYKAYVLDKEAPVVRGWGMRNRSSMVRIPHALKPEATLMELRCPDATGNVYLQFATLIFMGLKGLANKEDAGPPDMGSTYKKNLQSKVLDPR